MRKIAAGYLARERPNHTLQPTALVNEAYLRLIRQEIATFVDRRHFYGLAARLMRQVLVDAARARSSAKRGAGGDAPYNDNFAIQRSGAPDTNFMALHEALDKLQMHNERAAQTIELRYFGGMDQEEIADHLAVSIGTVKRDLVRGEAWIRRALTSA